MPLLLRSGIRYYLRHKWQGALALVGVALGVAIVLAVDLASSSANTAFEESAQQIKGHATHRIIGTSGTVDEAIYVSLATAETPAKIAPVISHWVEFEAAPGAMPTSLQLLGLDPFAEAPFRGSVTSSSTISNFANEWFTQPGATLFPRTLAARLSLSMRDTITIRHKGRLATLHIIGFHDLPSDFLLTDIATAQEVSGLFGLLSHIDIISTEENLSKIRPLLPESVRLVNAQRNIDGLSQLSGAFQLNLTALSLLALLVGMFLIFNAISFSFIQRRVLIGRLRAIGVTESELFRVLLMETLIIGALGCFLGILLGLWLGNNLTQLVAGTVNELYYRVSVENMSVQWFPLTKALLLGLIGTLVAAIIPAHQAAKAPPISALSRAYLEQKTISYLPRISILGGGLLVAGWVMAQVESSSLIGGFIGIFMLVIGAALLTPLLFHLSYLLLRNAPIPILGRMAVRDMNRQLSRLSIAGAALMVALSAGIGIGIMVDSMRVAVNDWLGNLLNADLYVAHTHLDEGALLAPELVRQLTTLPSAKGHSYYRHRPLRFSGRSITLVAAKLAEQSRAGFSLITPNPEMIWRRYDQGEIIVSEPLAYRLSLHTGSQLTLPTEKGLQPFTVAAIFRDYANEHGRIFINHGHYKKHWNDDRIGSVALFGQQGSPDKLIQQIKVNLSNADLSITQGERILEESQAIFDRTFRITEVLHLLALSIAFIGVLSALMALQLERAKEYAVLRSLGFTPRQMAKLISLGSLALGIVASIASIPTGLLMAWVLVNTIQLRAFGWTLPFEVNPSLLIQSLCVGILAALLAAAYPAWCTARSNPATKLREE